MESMNSWSLSEAKENPTVHTTFSQSVQKAIDQGVPYPDLEQWPVVLENHEVLESLQQVWRRMSEGDVKGMTLAARRVQGQINSQTYLPTRTWEAFSRAWPLLLFLSASLVVVVAWVRADRYGGSSQSCISTAQAATSLARSSVIMCAACTNWPEPAS